jgi:predicted XRE-type DNA-binding protein
MDKIEVRDWSRIREDMVNHGRINPVEVDRLKREMLDETRAFRLAELRKAQGLTQTALADLLAVAQSRVSQIESGDLQHSELGTLQNYIEALGGHLRVVADFGDQQMTVA